MSKPNINRIFCFLLVFNIFLLVKCEVYTALSDIEPLLETHKRILDDLEDYIQKEEKRLSILKGHLELYKREHTKAMEDIPNYLGNPINAFTLIKRLTSDLDNIEKSIRIGTDYIKNITMNHDDVKYPSEEDLIGAARALTRLQETYHLEISDLSEGILNGVVYSTPMTAGDCYELGRALYNEKDYKNTLAWMKEALRKYNEETIDYSFSEVDIMEYISFTHYLLGDVRTAYEWTKKLLQLDPKHVRAQSNVPHFKKIIAEEDEKLRKKRRGEIGEEEEPEKKAPPKLSQYDIERKKYEILCRGELGVPSEIEKRLTCRYLTENHPFLKIAPLKMEYKYLQPDIVIFYDVMSDDEIKFVQDMAKPRFKRAVVHDPKTGELVPAHYRISKSAWLRDEEDETIAKISQRIRDMTALDLGSAEELQVVNYGIGGHYEPHFDFARKHENAFTKANGNRIATVLFYMSDVAQGGATVFTELGVALFPKKGAAAYWLNLHPSGEGDMATRHAACPVLRGTKWVSNKWIHQGGQELIMPCSLEYQEEGMMRKIPRPVPKTFR